MGVRIQELPETTGINKEDVLIVEDGQGTKKGTVQQLDEALGVSQLKEDLEELKTVTVNHITKSDLQKGEYDLYNKSIKSSNSKICIKNLYQVKKGDKLVYSTNGIYVAYGFYLDGDAKATSYSGFISGNGEIEINYNGELLIQFAKNQAGNVAIEVDDYVADIFVYNSEITRYLFDIKENLKDYDSDFNKINLITEGLPNLLRKDTVIIDKRLDGTGELIDASGYYTTDFIRIKKGSKYIKNSPTDAYGNVDAYHRFCLFDEFENFKIALNSNTFENSEYSYVRFSGVVSEIDTTIFNEGESISNSYSAIDSNLRNKVGNITDILYELDRSKFGKYTIEYGELKDSIYNVALIDIVDFSVGDYVSINSDKFQFRICLYDDNGVMQKGTSWYSNSTCNLTNDIVENYTRMRIYFGTISGVSGYDVSIDEVIKCVTSNINGIIVKKFNDITTFLKNNKEITESVVKKIYDYEDNEKRLDILENIISKESNVIKNYDVCIVGGGASGVGCAYALRNSGLKVCLIEEQPYLGGTHTQGWVNVFAVTPSPKFLKNVIECQIDKGQACYSWGEHDPLTEDEVNEIDYKDTFIRQNHRADGKKPVHVVFNPRSMALKYYEDLSPYIDIMLCTSVVSANSENGVVTDLTTNNNVKIIANQFVDCSAQNVVLSLTGAEMLFGEDNKTRYFDEYGFTEQNAPDEYHDRCNTATLMFRVSKGDEDLSNVPDETFVNFSAYMKYNNNPNRVYVNPLEFIDSDAGIKVYNNGITNVYNSQAKKLIKYWKLVKNGFLKGSLGASDYKFDGYAPMLGIRELYRTKCERLLHESDLYVKVTNENIKSASNNLDKIIAVGNHHIDIRGANSVNIDAIEQNLVPYGVPYGCLIPKGYKNVLVASRGSGYTHIASASFRLTKDMMQIGWASGYAVRLLNENELDDFRNVNVETLQSEPYADIVSMVEDVVSLIN